jgi:hypothetical protein
VSQKTSETTKMTGGGGDRLLRHIAPHSHMWRIETP